MRNRASERRENTTKNNGATELTNTTSDMKAPAGAPAGAPTDASADGHTDATTNVPPTTTQPNITTQTSRILTCQCSNPNPNVVYMSKHTNREKWCLFDKKCVVYKPPHAECTGIKQSYELYSTNKKKPRSEFNKTLLALLQHGAEKSVIRACTRAVVLLDMQFSHMKPDISRSKDPVSISPFIRVAFDAEDDALKNGDIKVRRAFEAFQEFERNQMEHGRVVVPIMPLSHEVFKRMIQLAPKTFSMYETNDFVLGNLPETLEEFAKIEDFCTVTDIKGIKRLAGAKDNEALIDAESDPEPSNKKRTRSPAIPCGFQVIEQRRVRAHTNVNSPPEVQTLIFDNELWIVTRDTNTA